VAHSLLHASLIGCGLRLDEHGNLQAGLRIQGLDESSWKVADASQATPPMLYEGGRFVLHGAGRLPAPLVSFAAGAYVRAVVDELKTQDGMVFRDATLAHFHRAVARASIGVESVAVLTQPGEKVEGVYTNDFLLVRASSSRTFAENAKEVMRLWNTLNRDAEAETRLVFDVADVPLGDRLATEYSLDIAALEGGPVLPELRQAMEQLFGPGGKLRMWIVPVDDRAVLLATGTPAQVTALLEAVDRKRPPTWNHPEIAEANSLLPASADWRLFFSPHHYNQWYRRQMEAITGPVIGGPIVKEFPPASPVGFAGGVRGRQLWIDAAVPVATMKSAGSFLQKH
jgi:hypothetical protein